MLSPDYSDLDLTVSPQTSHDSKEVQRRRDPALMKNQLNHHKKTKRYSKVEFIDIIKDKSIKNETEVLAVAVTQAESCLMSLKNFVVNTPKFIES